MTKLNWCIKKSSYEIVEPSSNLSKAYLQKAQNSLDALSRLKGNAEWEISSAYYAIYFSLYAILMKTGVKCENHTCTIEFVKEFLKHFSEEEALFFETARSCRADKQYYTDREIKEEDRKKMAEKAPEIYIKCKEIINRMTESEINKIRSKLEMMIK